MSDIIILFGPLARVLGPGLCVFFMVFDRYLLKNLILATLFIALSLASVIMLTQSLRFLELIINSGASSLSFFVLTMLAMPRFFEVILPIALMIGTLFIYNRMSADSEIAIMKSSGFSPLRLSRPAMNLALATTFLAFVIAAWVAPMALSKMQMMRTSIKTQYSNLLLRDGVFNSIGQDLTVYVHDRNGLGELEGIMIHDTRQKSGFPITVLAKRGVIVSDRDKQQVIVYDGSRQEYNPQTGRLARLDFKRYSIDLPDSEPTQQRWREPDERTLLELLSPDRDVLENPKTHREFLTETHRRFVSPFLSLTFTLVALCCLLLGPLDRRGLGWRIVAASMGVITLQGLYLIAYNLAKEHMIGLVLMYVLVFVPIVVCFYFLNPASENFRRAIKAKLWRRS